MLGDNPEERTLCPTPSGLTNACLEFLASWMMYPMVVVDIVSAFVHAKEANERILMWPPSEMEKEEGWKPNSKVLRLKQVLYGRRSAPAAFREHLEAVIMMSPFHSMTRGVVEPCCYFCKASGLRITHHVDDLRLCGPSNAIQAMI